MSRVTFCIAALLAGLLVQAEPKRPGRTSKDNPRPGMRWVEQVPSKGGSKVALISGRKETGSWELDAGQQIEISLAGPTRLLVQSRRGFASRTAKAAPYSFLWRIDSGAEKKAGFKSKPHKTMKIKGRTDLIPGAQEVTVIDVLDGPHVVRLRAEAGRKAKIFIRLLVEKPKRAPGPKREGGPKKKKEGWTFESTYRFRITYEDNVWQLSDSDEHHLAQDADTDPLDKYDHMASNSDWIMEDEIDLHITNQGPLGRFTIGTQIDDKLYLDNRIRNSDVFQGYIKHKFAPHAIYKLFGSWGPDRFVRNLDSTKIPGRDASHAHYDDYRLGGRFWYRIASPLTATFTYTWELKDYNTKFNNRDSFLNHFDLGIRWQPTDWLSVDFDWEYVHSRARATGDEPDTSFHENSPRLALGFMYKGIILGAAYRYETRAYTTTNHGDVDRYHADRHDRRHVWKFEAGYRFSEAIAVLLEYTRVKRSSFLPHRPTADDPLEYESNGWQFTLEYNFK